MESPCFLEEKTSFYFPAGAAAGDSGAKKDERKIHFFQLTGGKNQLKPARPESALRRRKQGNVYACIKNTLSTA
ncbi:hypothetical protein C6Y45_04065 [Alkalicoccus saliphilus]|uniref:Uncharacterized protein n=1 Tax=Alkalicoccus saliphilus TaxID=200989 RepID=A0A2T4U8T9_9BACI|nr:hypothetical protein C6Y45_04065 [Alkalicoccus saliphilus]